MPQSTAKRTSPKETGLYADRAYNALLDRIVTIDLAPGEALREDALMVELDVGRTPLREAVKRLALENLVAVQPRRGTFVCDIETDDIVHIHEVRAELEGYAGERAAQRSDASTRAAAERLRAEVSQLKRGASQDELMRLDERIHRFFWSAAENPFLFQTLERYYLHSKRIWYLVLDRAPGLGEAVHDLDGVIGALTAGDGEQARRILHAHVLEFQREIIAALSG